MKTAREIANEVIAENRPFDYNWLRHVKKPIQKKNCTNWVFGVLNLSLREQKANN